MKSQQHVTIEHTHKRYKFLGVLAFITMMIGFVMVLAGSYGTGSGVIILGLLMTGLSRFLIWWNHE